MANDRPKWTPAIDGWRYPIEWREGYPTVHNPSRRLVIRPVVFSVGRCTEWEVKLFSSAGAIVLSSGWAPLPVACRLFNERLSELRRQLDGRSL